MDTDERLAVDGGAPVRSDFLVFGRPQILQPEIDEVVDTLRSGWIGTGPKTHEFEEQFKRYVGCQHALAVSSCTAALELALDVLEIGPGDEVILPPMTFASTGNVVIHRGATPVFVDIDRDTMNIDPERISDAVTERTKAIIPVHLSGLPCEMDEITALARRHELWVIEDAAHAIESYYRDRKVGAISDFSAFSFYATKNVTTAEGGMITTDNDEWAEMIRVRRLHGLSKDAWKRYSAEGFQPYETVYPGYKFNLTDLQASLGLHQLSRVEKNLELREKWWRLYEEGLSPLRELILPKDDLVPCRHARHLYIILIRPEMLTIDRDEFIMALKAENIGSGVHFQALHLHKYYHETLGYRRGDFPNAEFVSDRTISLPLSPAMSRKDVEDVVTAVKKIIRSRRR